jgi:hypothetical protein
LKLAWVEQHDARDKKAGDDEPKRKRSVPHPGFAFGHPASSERQIASKVARFKDMDLHICFGSWAVVSRPAG